MTAPLRTEICILGGGPAGATAALKLARLGHEVLVLEKEPFPRPHVGESLAPGLWQQLDLLGLADAVRAAGFPPAPPAIVCWAGRAETMPGSESAPGLLVDRGRFDRLLLDAAREGGAQVLQPARALRPRRTPDGWAVTVLAEGKEMEVTARFLVDATGRASRLGGRKLRTAAPTVALYTSWTPPRGAWRETRVEAGPDEWFWGAPLPGGTFNAMVFLDTDRYRDRRRTGTSRESLYRELLARSTLLCGLLEGEFPAEVLACDATCRHDPEPAGADFIKLGEAAFAIDPLSSSGVQVAMRTAWVGSIAVHTLLARPEFEGMAAGRFYGQELEDSVRRHRAWATAYHAAARSREGAFWQRRSREKARPVPPEPVETFDVSDLERRVRLSEAATLAETPCILGDLIATRRALHHPRLERAVAYLGDIEVAPLLDALSGTATLRGLTTAWSARVPPRDAFAVAHWLIRHGILVPAAC